jgi:acyl-CoA synthetase (AMP-forming)/AMP-acid ligase II
MTGETLAGALAGACDRWPERPALTFRDRTMTYGELGAAVAALAGRHRRAGVRPGDRVVCQASNSPELVVALGAAWACGAVHVGADWQLTVPELAWLIDHTDAAALVCEPPDTWPDPEAGLRELRISRPGLHVLTAAEVLRGEGPADPGPGPGAGDPAAIFVTSGTTGRPKTALGYHANLCGRWRWLASSLAFTPEDVHLTHLPLSHGFGMMMAAGGLLTGGRLVLLDRFSAGAALALVERERVTVLHGSPTHFRLLLDRREPGHDASSLRIGAGSAAAFPPALLRAIFDELGMAFMVMYGSSEGVGVVTTDREDMLLGSVGRPEPGTVAVLAPNGEPLPAGATGEIAFSRSRYPVRYWNGPEAPGAWYRSGDLGRFDEQGRLYVVGKLKHLISRGGLHVDPVEVENAILDLPGVADAAVVAAPNPVLGEVVCACLVPDRGDAPTLDELRAALGGRLAPHKLPEALHLLERIPRTRIGKVDLPALRALVAAPAAEPR